MTIREAVAVNVVLNALLGQKSALAAIGVKPTADAAGLILGSAAQLADSAHKVLNAGLTGELIREAWANEQMPELPRSAA